MPILPISNFRNYNVKPLSFNYTHNTIAPQSDKQVMTKDIPYSCPIAFKGKREDMKQILVDSNWAKGEFERLGIEAKIDKKDGLLTIGKFKEPDNTTYKKLGIDVARLIKNVKKIKEYADFSEYENLCVPNLEVVVGAMYCIGSKNIEFPKLKSANNIDCDYAGNIKFSKLTTAYSINCGGAKNIEFSKLTTVNNINCNWAKAIDISALKNINNIRYNGAKSIKLPEQIIEKMNVPRECIAND